MNFGTNLYWRATSDETTMADLNSALIAKNPLLVGKNVGIYVRNLLNVEIPDTNDSGLADYTIATQ
jgi:hypothetical protein